MEEILDIVQGMKPISLDEMSGVKLMNRIDTKYVVTEAQLHEILLGIRENYYAQEVEGNRLSPYSTVYYDTPELTMYLIHHDRHLVRDKVRVRTYVDSKLTFCEVKHKQRPHEEETHRRGTHSQYLGQPRGGGVFGRETALCGQFAEPAFGDDFRQNHLGQLWENRAPHHRLQPAFREPTQRRNRFDVAFGRDGTETGR